jgi:hypothetical protein
MKFIAFDKRIDALEERAKPRMIATLAGFVVWRAKWRRGIISIQFWRKAFGDLLNIPMEG